jgi:transcriptional antiterminator NusG
MELKDNHKWYVINTIIGRERKIAKSLKEEIEENHLEDMISEVVIPAETVVEVKRGKKVDIERKVCPGYILVKMFFNDRTDKIIRSIPGVAKFLGKDKKPHSIPTKEVEDMLSHLQSLNELHSSKGGEWVFSIGDLVRITDGAFEGFSAKVEAIDLEKFKLKVAVSIFGRETPVELDFKQATKAAEE